MIQAKAPGKLYIAGEYVVTKPGYKSVLIVVDRSVTAAIEAPNEITGTIHSKTLHYEPVTLNRSEDKIEISDVYVANRLKYVVTAIEVSGQYVKSCNIKLKHFHLTIDSNPADVSGQKYDSGSSVAVLVSVTKVLNEFYEMELSDLYIYKLAVISNMRLQSLSSYGDITASVYSGWLAYSTFDHEWVKQQMKETSVEEVLEKNWPGLHIEPLQAPENMEVLIGWTSSPASPLHLVSEVKRLKSDPIFYGEFLNQSNTCVENLIYAFRTNNAEGVQRMIRQNHSIIQQMDKEATADIKTEKLKLLCDIGERFGDAAETSGAGGGDCGITIIDNKVDKPSIYEVWEKECIKPSKLKIHHGQ